MFSRAKERIKCQVSGVLHLSYAQPYGARKEKKEKWPQITLGKWLQPLPRSVSYEQVWISEGDHGPGTKYPRCLAESSQTTCLMSSTEARNLNQRDLDLGEEVSQGVPRLSCGARLPSSSDAWGGPDTNEPRLPRPPSRPIWAWLGDASHWSCKTSWSAHPPQCHWSVSQDFARASLLFRCVVARPIQVDEQLWASWLPTELVTGTSVGGRIVRCSETPEITELFRRFLGRYRADRNL